MKKTIFTILTALVCASSLASAKPRKLGWENGNAGDIYGAEFILTARDLLGRIKMLGDLNIPGVAPQQFSGAIAMTTVSSENRVFLNGVEVDAKNIPEDYLIVVNRTRWDALRAPDKTRERYLLVFHEYLFIMGIDDSNFTVSEKVLALLEIDNFSPGHWWNPLNPANAVVPSLIFNPQGCKLEVVTLDPSITDQNHEFVTASDCGQEAFRRVLIRKISYSAPADSGYRGIFHRYDVQVFDRDNALIGSFGYEPDWGRCVLPSDGTCKLSGGIRSGGLNFEFWFLRN